MTPNLIKNQLGDESSPYLKQHKDNPVHWQAWGEKAFNLAKEMKKPILLSIGYAACHWCHVMAHESFEDAETAKLMNELYINIKVDREERPDVDSIYMTALAMMGQHGGWPLTMFLTPEGKPYWGGTYFPPTSRYGHPGFCDVLRAISSLYKTEPKKVEANIAAVLAGLNVQANLTNVSGPGLKTIQQVNDAAERTLSLIDFQKGGMSGAPKFPQPSFQKMLWQAYLRTGNKLFFDAVTTTLTHMCQGGIYDHLGGGFARYSTDALWLAPHFEKMLYDNAQLITLMTLVWQKTRAPLLETRIRETINWVLRDLKMPEGGFAGTLDADSTDAQGVSKEGAFYVWDETEIDQVLGENSTTFKKVYDVTATGNWEKTNILNRLRTLELLDAKIEERLKSSRKILLQARAKKAPPGLDNKILADWNGLMIAALSYAGSVFRESDWITAAENAFTCIQTHMANGPRLKHSYCNGEAKEADMIDDYACMIKGGLSLFQTTGNGEYIKQAIEWAKTAEDNFWDHAGAGYYLSPHDATDLIARTRTAFDNATPSGNGLMTENLARLYYLTGNEDYSKKAGQIIAAFTAKTPDQEANMPSLMSGFEVLTSGLQVIIIAETSDNTELFDAALSLGDPNLILMQLSPRTKLSAPHPASGKTQKNHKPTAYVCHGQTCGLPQINSNDLLRELSQHQSPLKLTL
ncbi:MAG: thioredoxin domain-containing protein [Rhodospirillales bacterium]